MKVLYMDRLLRPWRFIRLIIWTEPLFSLAILRKKSLLEVIARGHNRLTEISDCIHEDRGKCSKYLLR